MALFDRLQPELQEARVADIFSGTGTIGLEALSRGAASVVFIESDRQAVERLRRNVAALKAGDETMCWQTDASKCSFRPKGAETFLPYDVVFFDPPYLFTTRLKAGTMLYRSLERLARDEVTSPEALLVFRCAARPRSKCLPSGNPTAGSTIPAWKCTCSGKPLPRRYAPEESGSPKPDRPSK